MRGVPKRRNPKSEVVQVRLRPEEKLIIEQVAAAAGGNKSSWIYELMMRELALVEAQQFADDQPPMLRVAERPRDA